MVMAMDIHGLIGNNNDLPWHYPDDLKYFKNLTLNKKVLMGRRTFDSIVTRLNQPLPNRENIVATRNHFHYPDVHVINDVLGYIKDNDGEDIMIIGGKQIFDLTIELVDVLYITHIKHLFDGDQFMQIDFSKYHKHVIKETDDLIFARYERIK